MEDLFKQIQEFTRNMEDNDIKAFYEEVRNLILTELKKRNQQTTELIGKAKERKDDILSLIYIIDPNDPNEQQTPHA